MSFHFLADEIDGFLARELVKDAIGGYDYEFIFEGREVISSYFWFTCDKVLPDASTFWVDDQFEFKITECSGDGESSPHATKLNIAFFSVDSFFGFGSWFDM